MKVGAFGNLVVLGLALCLFSCPVWGILEVFDPDYDFETYATFDPNIEGDYRSMTFGPDGNLYVTWRITVTGRDGSIYKVEPDGSITQWVDEMVSPMGIVWAAGTDYGDYFYVCDPVERTIYSQGEVTRVSLDGTKTHFCGVGLNDPISLAIDTVGNYAGFMYVGSCEWDRINTVSTTGETELFYSIGNVSGTPGEIAFDGGGEYGNLMYVTTSYASEPGMSGVLMFDPEGDLLGTFSPELVGAYEVEFDEVGTMFGGDMFVRGSSDWEGSQQIWRVQPDGSCEQFCRGKYKIFTFGPDGAMYVLEPVDGVPTIQRVYRVSFLGGIIRDIEGAIADKQEAIVTVTSSLEKEQAAYDALAVIEPEGDLTEQDIAKAMKKLEVSIAEQGRVIGELEDSIFWLERVLSFLGVES